MPDTLIVVPCFNEFARLDEYGFCSFASSNHDFAFLFVNDGSSDTTIDKLKSMNRRMPDKLKYLDLATNVGKAEAVRQGIQQHIDDPDFNYFGFLDADLATPLSQLLLLRDAQLAHNAGMVTGCRVRRQGARIERRALRHYFGRVFATIVSLMLAEDIYDSQCGLKILNREFAQVAFRDPFCSRWIFDVELFARVNQINHGARSVEVPLTLWEDKRGSKITFRSLVTVPIELFRIHRTYKRRAATPTASLQITVEPANSTLE